MKALRRGFTIVEILISVIILSFAIIFVLKLHTDNQEQILYILERNQRSLEDSLYLHSEVLSHHKDKKSAYALLKEQFNIKEDKSRRVLKEIERTIFIPEPLEISMDTQESSPRVRIEQIMLKNEHSARYYHFTIEAL